MTDKAVFALTCLVALTGAKYLNAAAFQFVDIFLGACLCPHGLIHGRRQGDPE